MSVVQFKSATRGRVTINDLARELGLAKGTVSRALNGYPDISESTRLRVVRMAERMGYRPMAQAQAIRTGLSRSLGLVAPSGHKHHASRLTSEVSTRVYSTAL